MPHANACLTPRGRQVLVTRIADGWPVSRAARAAGISRQTGSKWWNRYRREGSPGLVDRRSVVRRQARAHPPELGARLFSCGASSESDHTGWRGRRAWRARRCMPSCVVTGLGRLDRLEPRPPVIRYERAAPGELLHLDTKQLGRIRPGGGLPKPQRAAGYGAGRKQTIGWNRVHVAVDDHSRISYVEELADEAPATTVGFLRRAVAFYARHGISVERVLTDNGNPYRSRAFVAACAELAVSPRRTRPYRPQTNGASEFERFIRTLLHEWAYPGAFHDTAARVASLPRFVDFYNRSRPHWSLNGQAPMSRAPVNNLRGKNS
jgi:transposase InsO family protein